MAEQSYRIAGTRAVAGVKPGGTLVPPPDVNVRALVKAGHLEPVAEPKPEPETEPRPAKINRQKDSVEREES